MSFRNFLLVFLKTFLLYGCLISLAFSLKGQICYRTEFRTINGTCNNLQDKNRGKAKVPFLRALPAQYGPNNPYKSLLFPDRPNPRAISNAVFSQDNKSGNKANLSSFVFTWGQFLDHDLTLAQPATTESRPIKLPSDEPNFTSPIAFNRSAVVAGTGSYSPRNQENELTTWMDGSQVYGSDLVRANWLRTFSNGKLKTSAGGRLPYNTIDGQKNSPIDVHAPKMDPTIDRATKFYVAGDMRAFEQPGLTALHTLFVREHNRICDELVQLGYRTDEYIYQVARKRIGALIQVITYNEFLPALGIRLNAYYGYQPWVRPDIMNLFATAGFRLGHTMVTNELLVLDDNCNNLSAPISLDQAFLTDKWIENFNIDPILKGLMIQQQEEIDAKIVDGLRNFLFAPPQGPTTFGLDLASLNIQRGRDHGIPTYQTVRSHFLGQNIIYFNQITHNTEVKRQLKSIYNSVRDIDLWVGLMAEDHLSGSNVGPTLHEILSIQFERIRNGDFYFYLNDPFFNFQEKADLTNTSLSDLIKRNTSLKNISTDVFHSLPCQPIVLNGAVINCGATTIQYGSGQISIKGQTNSNYYFKINDLNNGWQIVAHCGWSCGNEFVANNLPNGNYLVTIYNADWSKHCYSEIVMTNSSFTGTAQNRNTAYPIDEESIRVFPNPTMDELFLDLSVYVDSKGVLTLANQFGQIVQQVELEKIKEELIQLPTHQLINGLYYLTIQIDNYKPITKKVLVHRLY